MKKSLTIITLAAVLGLLLSNCGKNPFGPGAAGGLDFFAKLGAAIGKPSAINEEENGKEGAKSTVTQGAAKRYLAKGASGEDVWQVANGIDDNGDGTLTYWEDVRNKPDDRDPAKRFTGRAEVVFVYNGTAPSQPSDLNPALVTDIKSWHANGREVKTWKTDGQNMATDSIDISITFSQGSLQDPASLTPGLTKAWGKNISATTALGRGDTGSFELTRLDDDAKIQYGEGHFYDAINEDGEAKAFDFDMQIIHKNAHPELTGGCDNPYLRYKDNEGVMSFTVPWGQTGKNLYFHLHFYPPVDGALGYRAINIYEENQSGEKLYYAKVDDHGQVLEEENYYAN